MEIKSQRKAKTFHRTLSSKIKVTLYNYWSLSSNLKFFKTKLNRFETVCPVRFMTVVSKQNWLCSFQSTEADYLYINFRLEPCIMSRPLDVWNTANSGSSERYLWPRYQTGLACYNKLRHSVVISNKSNSESIASFE